MGFIGFPKYQWRSFGFLLILGALVLLVTKGATPFTWLLALVGLAIVIING